MFSSNDLNLTSDKNIFNANLIEIIDNMKETHTLTLHQNIQDHYNIINKNKEMNKKIIMTDRNQKLIHTSLELYDLLELLLSVKALKADLIKQKGQNYSQATLIKLSKAQTTLKSKWGVTASDKLTNTNILEDVINIIQYITHMVDAALIYLQEPKTKDTILDPLFNGTIAGEKNKNIHDTLMPNLHLNELYSSLLSHKNENDIEINDKVKTEIKNNNESRIEAIKKEEIIEKEEIIDKRKSVDQIHNANFINNNNIKLNNQNNLEIIENNEIKNIEKVNKKDNDPVEILIQIEGHIIDIPDHLTFNQTKLDKFYKNINNLSETYKEVLSSKEFKKEYSYLFNLKKELTVYYNEIELFFDQFHPCENENKNKNKNKIIINYYENEIKNLKDQMNVLQNNISSPPTSIGENELQNYQDMQQIVLIELLTNQNKLQLMNDEFKNIGKEKLKMIQEIIVYLKNMFDATLVYLCEPSTSIQGIVKPFLEGKVEQFENSSIHQAILRDEVINKLVSIINSTSEKYLLPNYLLAEYIDHYHKKFPQQEQTFAVKFNNFKTKLFDSLPKKSNIAIDNSNDTDRFKLIGEIISLYQKYKGNNQYKNENYILAYSLCHLFCIPIGDIAIQHANDIAGANSKIKINKTVSNLYDKAIVYDDKKNDNIKIHLGMSEISQSNKLNY